MVNHSSGSHASLTWEDESDVIRTWKGYFRVGMPRGTEKMSKPRGQDTNSQTGR